MKGLFKSKLSNISLLFATLLFCINMGSGKYAESVTGEEPPFFVLKDGLLPFSGTIIDAGKESMAEKICFYDPTDEDCRSGGKPAGVTYLKVFEKDSNLRSKIDLHNIKELKVSSQDSDSKLYVSERHHTSFTKNRIFVTIKITSIISTKDKEEGKKEEGKEIEYLANPDISVGFINPKTGAKVNVFLRKIDSIEIKHPEVKETKSESKEDKDKKGKLETMLFGE